jgi:hypothetical protein
MPFEISPKETGTKVGKFQDVADAILRGCATTKQCRARIATSDGGAVCAVGAMMVGMGLDPLSMSPWGGFESPAFLRFCQVENAYNDRYGCAMATDNDDHGFTREQIAARVAAL